MTASPSETIHGAAIAPRTSAVQRIGEPGSTVQPATRNTTCAISLRLRRRLSKIFQRESRLRRLRSNPSGPGTLRVSHCSNCQSPRIHRCLRREKVRYRVG